MEEDDDDDDDELIITNLRFSRGKERPGRDADPLPPSSAVVIKA